MNEIMVIIVLLTLILAVLVGIGATVCFIAVDQTTIMSILLEELPPEPPELDEEGAMLVEALRKHLTKPK